MKKVQSIIKYWWLLLLVATFCLVYIPTHNHLQSQQLTTQMYGQQFTASSQTPISINVTGSGTQWYQISWNVTGTLSACSVKIDSSADGSTWNNGDIIAAQTCTSNGNFSATAAHTVNFVRINPNATITGTGTLTITLTGYQNFPGTVNPNNGVAGALATFPAGSGSTTVTPDTSIWSNGTGTLEVGQAGVATGNISINGTTSGSVNMTCAATCNTWQTASPIQVTANSGISVKHITQNAANNFMGTCTMAAATTCTATVNLTYTTPICFTSVQSAAPTTFQGSCALSGTTVTITASAANSNVWAYIVVGNPN